MRIREIREQTVPISRYEDPSILSGGLTTSLVALVTDAVRDGTPVVGLGFASFGRFGQGGLADGAVLTDGMAALPEAPGIGFEGRAGLLALIRKSLLD